MDLEQKVTQVFEQAFAAERVELDTDGGVSGIVVSAVFRGRESIDRQQMIYDALRKYGLSEDEVRDVLMISALTPEEAVGYSVF